jgi:hypothetical protein
MPIGAEGEPLEKREKTAKPQNKNKSRPPRSSLSLSSPLSLYSPHTRTARALSFSLLLLFLSHTTHTHTHRAMDPVDPNEPVVKPAEVTAPDEVCTLRLGLDSLGFRV